MSYTYGQTPTGKARERLAKAQARADELAAEVLEAENQATQARLDQLTQARTTKAIIYPVDPHWYEHRQTLDHELRAWSQRHAA